MRLLASLDLLIVPPIALAIGVKYPLVAGAAFPVTATFAHGGRIATMATAQKSSVAMPTLDPGSMADMTLSGTGSNGCGGAQ